MSKQCKEVLAPPYLRYRATSPADLERLEPRGPRLLCLATGVSQLRWTLATRRRRSFDQMASGSCHAAAALPLQAGEIKDQRSDSAAAARWESLKRSAVLGLWSRATPASPESRTARSVTEQERWGRNTHSESTERDPCYLLCSAFVVSLLLQHQQSSSPTTRLWVLLPSVVSRVPKAYLRRRQTTSQAAPTDFVGGLEFLCLTGGRDNLDTPHLTP
ncbi:hypothetical protein CSOJ01_13537 [Colletotrichum sojae]|uniref:Uncharacterized protein n=1 Tax=Colletotrichum sojae TaxID=2175907 RepID=A0A8H6IST0_9PEZI|nr:hypothetical protein CSOJ01_13537 [Colletotrichum sojae]